MFNVRYFICIVFFCVTPTSLVYGNSDCGVYALQQGLSLIGIDKDYNDLYDELNVTRNIGTSFLDIVTTAKNAGANSRALNIKKELLFELELPAIAFVDGNHFVTIAATDGIRDKLYVLDGVDKAYWCEFESFKNRWSGDVVVFKNRKQTRYPKLWVRSQTIDIGTLRGVSGEKRELTVLNIGRKPLTISNPKFSCNCAKVNFDEHEIIPNSFFTIKVEIDASHKRKGKFKLGLLITTNEESGKAFRAFSLQGHVKRQAALTPSYFSLGRINPEEKLINLVSYLQIDGYEGEVYSEGITDALSIDSIEKLDGEKGKFKIACRLQLKDIKTDGYGRFYQNVLVRTDHRIYKRLELGVSGCVVPYISAYPEMILVQDHDNDSLIRREIIVDTILDEPIELEVERSDLVKATINQRNLIIEMTPKTNKPLFQTHIIIKQGCNTLEVPIYYVNKRAILN